MGEVYRARDTRLDRVVAIKVLPSELAADPERRSRLEREARAVSSLTHPHICTLHDVGRQDGTDYLVLEYLEGQSLAERLQKGPLPLDQALRTAAEIADALDKAHRKGIVHRDLKPGNVMLTKTGAKLLDFGLAKLDAPPALTGTTVSVAGGPLTAEGTLLGTYQYMAPEQIEGRPADARADIWAFGAVLYEMVTGNKAFAGKSAASVIGAILEREPPPMTAAQPATPEALDRVVRACLSKDPDERWQNAHDLATELQSLAQDRSRGVSPATTPGSRRRGVWIAAGAAALVALAAWAGWRMGSGGAAAPRPPVHLSMALPTGQTLALGRGSAVVYSPDGRRIAYVANHGNSHRLYLRPLDRSEPFPLEGTDGAEAPVFSPDGDWLAFFAENKLKKVSTAGGGVATVCVAPEGRGATWVSNDAIVFAGLNASGLSRVSAHGGTPEPLTTIDSAKGERSHRWPQALPDGKSVLFTIIPAGGISFDQAQIGTVSLATGQRSVVLEGGSYGQYVPTGHLLYVREGNLMAVPFDLARLKVSGAAVPVLEGVWTNASGGAHVAFSPTGPLAYVPGGAVETQRTLMWVDRGGRAREVTDRRQDFLHPRLSPSADRVAVAIRMGKSDIWVYELSRGTLTRLTSGSGSVMAPSWTPDGQRLTFAMSSPGSTTGLFVRPADGSGPAEPLVTNAYTHFNSCWSPDGKHLAFDEQRPDTGWDVWVLSVGQPQPQPFVRTPANESAPVFSPDGRWLAYSSDETGRAEVYVQRFPGPGGRWQVSAEGGSFPLWARSGRELFYRNGDKMMAADVSSGPAFSAGRPHVVFEGAYLSAIYDVSPDGRSFLMTKAGDRDPASAQVNVILDWIPELARRVPAAR
jgi:eukaryotic-like serine/threonine-protein kinase